MRLAWSGPSGGIKILNAHIRDKSARPFLRLVDPFGFWGIEVSGTVDNPYGCGTEASAGFPLRNIMLARIPVSNLSVHVVCNTSVD